MTFRNRVNFYGDGYYESGTDFLLRFNSPRIVRLDPTSATDVDLPDATTIPNWGLGGPLWVVQNLHASNDITIKDNGGNTIGTLTASPTGSEYDIVSIYLSDNSTANGEWHLHTAQAGSAPAPNLDELVYWLGGATTPSSNNDVVDKYDVTGDSWSTGTTSTQDWQESAVAVVNDKGYVHGGLLNGHLFNHSYDAGSDVWAVLTDLNSGGGCVGIRHGAALSGNTYAFGLSTSSPFGVQVQEYSVSGDSWTTKTNATDRNDNCCSNAYTGGSVIFVYGINLTGSRERCYKFDPTANSWTRTTNQPFNGRSHSGAMDTESNDKVYLARGADNVLSASDAVFEHTLATDTFVTKADHPEVGSFEQGHARANGRLFHGGGGSDTDFWEYTAVLDSWTARTAIPRTKNDSYDQMAGINAG